MGWPSTEGTGAFPRREPEWITPSRALVRAWLTFCRDVWTRRPPTWWLVAETHVETAPPDRRRQPREAESCCRRRATGDRRKAPRWPDRKSTRLNSSHSQISYAVFCLKKKKEDNVQHCRVLR